MEKGYIQIKVPIEAEDISDRCHSVTVGEAEGLLENNREEYGFAAVVNTARNIYGRQKDKQDV